MTTAHANLPDAIQQALAPLAPRAAAVEAETADELLTRIETNAAAVELAAREQALAGITAAESMLIALRGHLVPGAVVNNAARNAIAEAWREVHRVAVAQRVDFADFRPTAEMRGDWNEHVLASAIKLTRNGQGDGWDDADGYDIATESREVIVAVIDGNWFGLPAEGSSILSIDIGAGDGREVELDVAFRLVECQRVAGQLIAVYEVQRA